MAHLSLKSPSSTGSSSTSATSSSTATATATATATTHDLLALGEYQDAFLPSSLREAARNIEQKSSKSTATIVDNSEEILRRLPIVLRLLSSSQPLSSIGGSAISTRLGDEEECSKDDDDEHRDDSENQKLKRQERLILKRQQNHIDDIVSIFEIIAVTYPQAESLEKLTLQSIPNLFGTTARIKYGMNQNHHFNLITRGKNQIVKVEGTKKACQDISTTNVAHHDSGDSKSSPQKLTPSSNNHLNQNKEQHPPVQAKRKKLQNLQEQQQQRHSQHDNMDKEQHNKAEQDITMQQSQYSIINGGACLRSYSSEFNHSQRTYLHSGWDTSNLLNMHQRFKEYIKNHGNENSHSSIIKNESLTKSSLDYDDDNADAANHHDEDMKLTAENNNHLLQNEYHKVKKRKIASGESSISISALHQMKEEDSQELSICKICVDIVQLVIASLQPLQLDIPASLDATSKTRGEERVPKGDEAEDPKVVPRFGVHEMNHKTSTNKAVSNNSLLQLSPDSNLTETIPMPSSTVIANSHETLDSDCSSNSSQEYPHSNLSSMIVAILHNIPMLRYEHIANALCRTTTTIPQCAHIIQRLAANSPSTTSCLLRGCINAYHYGMILLSQCKCQTGNSIGDENDTELAAKRIMKVAEESVACIARLSKRETSHVITTLKQSHAMPELILELLVECNYKMSLSILLEDLIMCGNHTEADLHMSRGKCNNHRSIKLVQRRKQKQCSVSGVIRDLSGENLWILKSLNSNPILASKLRLFMLSKIQSIRFGEKPLRIRWGEASLILRVYSGLIYSIGNGSQASPGSGAEFVTTVMNLISEISQEIQSNLNYVQNDTLPNSSNMDEFVMLITCACAITCIKFTSIANGNDSFVNTPSVASCMQCIKDQFEWNISQRVKGFLLRFSMYIRNQSRKELKKLLLDTLAGKRRLKYEYFNGNALESKLALKNFCRWATSLIEEKITTKIVPRQVNGYDLPAIINGIKNSTSYGVEYDDFIQTILMDATKYLEFIGEEVFVDLLRLAAMSMASRAPPIIPLILPLTIESNISSLMKNYPNQKIEKKKLILVVNQLIYAFSFLGTIPESPYAITPRLLPLGSILALITKEEIHGKSFLEKMIMKYYPETFSGGFSRSISCHEQFWYPEINQVLSIKDLGNEIRNWLKNPNPNDTLAIERLFVHTMTIQSSDAVDVEVSSALLESVEHRHFVLTHTKLCEDPIMLMKCSLKVWLDNGLRRILLSIMQRLMDSNEQLVMETAVTSQVAREYLVTRDSIILRSWLFILSGVELGDDNLSKNSFGIHCPLLVSMVRSLVAKRNGVVTTMVKQALPGQMIDWIVANIPEIGLEAEMLLSILEKSASLSAVERLNVANSAFRLALIHRNRKDIDSEKLVYSALSILVGSFQSIIGVVGVPANVIYDQDGRDTIQIFRKSLLRMLLAIKDFQDHIPNKIANEIRAALSQLATLCKSDLNLSGLTGVTVQKRRKEVWDCIVKLNSILGGGVQL